MAVRLKPPEPRDASLKHAVTTIKTSLKAILGDTPNGINDLSADEKHRRILDAVLRTNNLVFHTTHFLELYLLHLFQTGQTLPDVTVKFIKWCMKVVSSESDNLGRYSLEARKVIQSLNDFYAEYYEPLLGPNPEGTKVSDYHMGNTTDYEAQDILKNIKTNISTNFLDHVRAWVNRHWKLKEGLKAIDGQSELTGEQKKLAKSNLSNQMRLVKEDLFSPIGAAYASSPQYHEWLDASKRHIAKARYDLRSGRTAEAGEEC